MCRAIHVIKDNPVEGLCILVSAESRVCFPSLEDPVIVVGAKGKTFSMRMF
jgi:hypothetical protein